MEYESYAPSPDVEYKATGPATLTDVMTEIDRQMLAGQSGRFQAIPLGFNPLDDVLNGGLRPGELLVMGGAFGVGKTIFGLQVARNVVARDPEAAAMYVCYEHDRSHLLQRLLCLESAEHGHRDSALNLRRLANMALEGGDSRGLIDTLAASPRYAAVVTAMKRYADRLVLTKASGSNSTLSQITEWAQELHTRTSKCLMVVDYLQKIPVDHAAIQEEAEVTTYLTQGLKELAMTTGLRILAIAASDRVGLKSTRMRLSDLRGSSALQYEADIGLVLNNKFNIISREHMVYNLSSADAMRNYVVMSIEKNRAGRAAVDMEYVLDAMHFRMITSGDYVRDRLVDDKVILA